MRAYTESFNISLGASSSLLCLSEERWQQGDISFGLSQLWRTTVTVENISVPEVTPWIQVASDIAHFAIQSIIVVIYK